MYEIIIEDIPEEGMEVEATESDAWLADAVKDALAGSSDGGFTARLRVGLARTDGNVNVDGDIDLVSHQTCDRCAGEFEKAEAVHVHTVLAPKYESERQRRLEEELEVELVEEDVEFSFYEGDRFDLAEVIREQIVLAQPMQRLCRPDCKGLCQNCGKNLNEGPCDCHVEARPNSFAALEGVRIKGNTTN
jgi:uncharacterized protein